MSEAMTGFPAPEDPAPPSPPDVLVTGASGFVGSHLARRLSEAGHQVRVLMRPGTDLSGLAGVPLEVVAGTLADTEALAHAAAGVRHVYHCAAVTAPRRGWEAYRQANVLGPRAVVEAAHRAGSVERVVLVSAADVYGYPALPCDEEAEPRDTGLPYQRSRLLGEQAAREAAARTGVPLTVVRPATVYGPGGRDAVVGAARRLLAGRQVLVGRGEAAAGLCFVTNLADALIAAADCPAAAGRVYNVRDPEPVSWRRYLTALAEGLGARPPRLSLPLPAAQAVAAASEALHGVLRRRSAPSLTRQAARLWGHDQCHPVDRAQRDFGLKGEVGFEEGMRRTLAWLDSAEGRLRVPR
jgi:nucleoside-diphosphate-sugar epimerase